MCGYFSPNVDQCQSTACMNDGTCFDDGQYVYCHCVPGYNGTLCDHGTLRHTR